MTIYHFICSEEQTTASVLANNPDEAESLLSKETKREFIIYRRENLNPIGKLVNKPQLLYSNISVF